MSALGKTLGFSLALTLAFTGIANILPQVEGEAPKEIKVELGSLTMDSFIQMGQDLFNGKGTCNLCHNSLGRAPDIPALNMVDTAEERLADSRYKGEATDAESYLLESMAAPSAFVVEGFGKKGSNDTVSPMPNVAKAPTELSETEMSAIIAYLQAKNGNEVTVALPTAEEDVELGDGDDGEEEQAGPAETAEAALEKFGCSACHNIMGSEADLGPDLETVSARLSVDEIRQSIVDPHAVIAEGYEDMMPDYFSEEMFVKELDLIVQFLAGQEG
ncbi:MAG: hypothetical protein ACE5EM_10670 [Sphingomonadales bacterium]